MAKDWENGLKKSISLTLNNSISKVVVSGVYCFIEIFSTIWHLSNILPKKIAFWIIKAKSSHISIHLLLFQFLKNNHHMLMNGKKTLSNVFPPHHHTFLTADQHNTLLVHHRLIPKVYLWRMEETISLM